MQGTEITTTNRRKMMKILLALPLLRIAASEAASSEAATYEQEDILKAATEFLGNTTEGLGRVIAKAFQDMGKPTGYIKGQEFAGAVTVGLRYGEGVLNFKSGGGGKIFWQGPSIGIDLGGNASKVFVLIYHASSRAQILKRFPSVDGSWYYVGGAGINYQRRDKVSLAPIRLGVGLRAGASIGYTHYTASKTLNPL